MVRCEIALCGKARLFTLIGRFHQRGFSIGRRQRHVMYGRAGLLIRKGGFLCDCWAGLALTSWLAGLGNKIPRGPVAGHSSSP